MTLSYLRKEYLDELEDSWNQHGRYPTPLKDYIFEPEFQLALKTRDLPIPTSKHYPPNQGKLSPHQRAAIRLLRDYHDKRPLRTKLKEIGVTSAEYQSWLRNEHFKKSLIKEVDQSTSFLPVDSKISLAQLVTNNDLNAIKYYNELTGIYRPNNETILNLSLIIAQLMDILVSYLRPDQLTEIASKLEGVLLNEGKPSPESLKEVQAISPPVGSFSDALEGFS